MTATESAPEQEHSVKADTIYFVLIHDVDARTDASSYAWADQVAAKDAKAAVQFVAERLARDGEPVDEKAVFVAIPKRYWSALSVKTETHTTITIEDAT